MNKDMPPKEVLDNIDLLMNIEALELVDDWQQVMELDHLSQDLENTKKKEMEPSK